VIDLGSEDVAETESTGQRIELHQCSLEEVSRALRKGSER
jgi:hypothetical protein